MREMKKEKIVVILGPTASGKSALAVKLAKRFHGEIVSADSRQIYRGLDVGTGKISKKDMRGVPHHLLDLASPRRQITAAEYADSADHAIQAILRHKKMPIMVGGTGLYIDAVARGIQFPKVPPNKKLRKQLSFKSAGELWRVLQRLDPRRARLIDRKNPLRLIRAIEIAKTLGNVPPIRESRPYAILWIGVKKSKKELNRLIRQRLLKRLRQGMIQEARRLHRSGLSYKRMHELGLEYRYLAFHLKGLIGKREMIFQLEKAIRDYAKRQMTWFKRNPEIRWIARDSEAEKLVRRFIGFKTRKAT